LTRDWASFDFGLFAAYAQDERHLRTPLILSVAPKARSRRTRAVNQLRKFKLCSAHPIEPLQPSIWVIDSGSAA
jgi:hypothetical protein